MAVLIQNLNRALFCLILTPGNKISFLGSYQKALTRCCNDPLRPPDLSGLGRCYDIYRLSDCGDSRESLSQHQRHEQRTDSSNSDIARLPKTEGSHAAH